MDCQCESVLGPYNAAAMVHDKKVMGSFKNDRRHMNRIHFEIAGHWDRIEHVLGCNGRLSSGYGSLGRVAIWEPYELFEKYVTKKTDRSFPGPDNYSEIWYETPAEDLSD